MQRENISKEISDRYVHRTNEDLEELNETDKRHDLRSSRIDGTESLEQQ